MFFGILAGDVLYLKVDDETKGEYERRAMPAFNPYPGRTGRTRYYEVPLDVLESAAELARWARHAVAAAKRGKAGGSAAP